MSSIMLNVAERNMLRSVFVVFSGMEDLDTDSILEIASITEALDLESAEKVVSDMEREILHARMLAQRQVRQTALEIENIDKNDETVPDSLFKKHDDAQEKLDNMPASLSYSVLHQSEREEYHLDRSSIDWLLETLKKYKWNSSLSRSQSGEVTVIKRILNPEESVVAASLVRSVKSASV